VLKLHSAIEVLSNHLHENGTPTLAQAGVLPNSQSPTPVDRARSVMVSQ
jgi:hypothetical protein